MCKNEKFTYDSAHISCRFFMITFRKEITGVSSGDSSHFQNLYEEVKNKFSNNSKVRIVRDYSVNAAKMFDNEYFDFVYLDGDHGYEAVLKDLEVWYPKLKKYGVMCGDDYGHPSGLGVIKAVYEFAYKHKVIVNYETDNQFYFVKV